VTAAEPLVLLPGMNCSPRLWQPVLDSPAFDRGRGPAPVLQPELRGRSLDDCVARLLAQLPERFSLAGLSLGAIVALALAREAPDRVARLALLAINPRAPRPEQQAGWAAQRRALAEGGTARALQEQLLPVLVADGSRSRDLDEVVLTMADEVGESALDDQLAIQQTRRDERPTLSRLVVPIAVIAGTEDMLVPVERHEEVCAAVRTAHLDVLPGVGHLSTLEAPEAVASVLATWLRR
jgi:pimeloyl-ACP methyl ester carboxylesterase